MVNPAEREKMDLAAVGGWLGRPVITTPVLHLKQSGCRRVLVGKDNPFGAIEEQVFCFIVNMNPAFRSESEAKNLLGAPGNLFAGAGSQTESAAGFGPEGLDLLGEANTDYLHPWSFFNDGDGFRYGGNLPGCGRFRLFFGLKLRMGSQQSR